MNKNYGKAYYEKSKNSNYLSYKDKPYNRAIINFLSNYKKEGKLLEVGCAYGYFLSYAEKNFETYGMDISEYAIKQAKKISPKSKLKAGDIEKDLIKFISNKKFDIIVALDVLEHLKNPKKVLKIFFQYLNSGGILVFRIPNKSAIDYQYYRIFESLEKWHGNKDKTHVSLYSLKKWKSIGEKAGFKVELLPYIPTIFLKEIVIKQAPKLFFLPSCFSITNKSITFFCTKS